MKPLQKIVTLEDLKRTPNSSKNQKTVVLITGCFDVLHVGHVDLFREAKSLGGVVIVGLDNDDNIKQNKGEKRPIFSYASRAKVISELSSVDYVFEITQRVTFNSVEADTMLLNVLEAIRPTHLVTHAGRDNTTQRKKELCRTAGVTLVASQQKILKLSSTKIIDILDL